MKIIDPVFFVPRVMANSYILVDPDGLTLIDTGMPHSEKKTLKYISELGWSPRELKRILITHADLDHYGCLAALQQASGACTYAGRREAEAMAKGQSSRPVNRSVGHFQRFMINMMGSLLKPTPIQVDEILTEGQVLPVLGGLQVLSTPGHSPDHLSFFSATTGILFCGDSMRSNAKGLHVSRSRNNWNQPMAESSAKKQAALQALIICPGHGPVIRESERKIPV